jgi:c-di-GMP-binding flagellar brake protein YcgR
MISILSRVGVSARRMHAAANVIADGDQKEAPAGPATGSSDAPWQIIGDPHQIGHVLRHILDMKHEVTLTGKSRQHMARSRIVGIDSALGGHFLIERVTDDSAHAALLRDGRVNLGGRFLELPIVCTVDISQVGELEGKPCYRVPLPNWILFSEMRDSWRVRPPEAPPVRLIYSPPGQATIAAHVVDISEGGIGLLLPPQPSYQPTADECWQATLHSGNGESISLGLDLLHVGRHFSGGYRIGATIHPGTAEDHQRLHHLIVRHQLLFTELN